jgi:cytochrome c biogenesis protein CcmG, thiol:disulfide interchange protein DsbE
VSAKNPPSRRQRQPARPRRRTRWLVAGLAVVLIAAVGLAATALDDGGASGGSTDPEAFDLPALRGEGRVRLADFRGTPVVVNFFASWCTACDAELPGFAKVSDELDGRVAFVGVNSNETGDPLYMPRRHGIADWPLARDIGGRNGSGLHQALGGRGMPITAFYDARGKLLHVDLGALPEPALRQRLDDLYGTRTAEAT